MQTRGSPGGLAKAIHSTLCPINTPEGQNSEFFLKKIHIELDFLLAIVVIHQNAISYSFNFF